jgi:hypothetical protein
MLVRIVEKLRTLKKHYLCSRGVLYAQPKARKAHIGKQDVLDESLSLVTR